MKITHIEFSLENLDLLRPYTIAYKTVSEVQTVLVRVWGENGLYGLGAANPSRAVVGDGPAETFQVLQTAVFDGLLGQDIRALRACCEWIASRFGQHPGAQAALDIALHDLYGQVCGLPLAQVLGQHHHRLPTSITIGIKGVEDTLAEAAEYVGRGFRHLKVKLGHAVEEDVARLQALRSTYGEDVHLRVDANQGYDMETLRYFFAHTSTLGLELVEQPVQVKTTSALRTLPEAQRLLLAADESLRNAQDAYLLATHPIPCGIFNIKLMKCGGVYQALRIAEVARLAGIDLMWGCNDESIISIAAALHAAFACPHTRYLDLDGSLDLARDLVQGGFVIEDGYMSLAGGPGLGVRLL
ncbi:MAG: dipeptide epimerase [Bacteroidia bacterium]